MMWSDKANLFSPRRISLLTFVQQRSALAGSVCRESLACVGTGLPRLGSRLCLTVTAPSTHSLAPAQHNAIQNIQEVKEAQNILDVRRSENVY